MPFGAVNLVSVFSVGELAERKGVKMAQIAFAWSAKKVTAPIVGTTKLDNLKEMIGENRVLQRARGADQTPVDALEVELSDEDLEYLEKPYKPNPILGHV